MTDSSASSHAELSSSRAVKEGRRPELGRGRAMSGARRPPALLPTHCPGTRTPYSHRAFLLKALPLGSTGGPGRQDVQEDAHLAAEGEAKGGSSGGGQLPPQRARQPRLLLTGMPKMLAACSAPVHFLTLTETAKATGPAKLQMSVS